MKQQIFVSTDRDFKGDHLCESCWNNHHFHNVREGSRSIVIVDCKGGNCECHCREILAEKAARPKKLKGPDPRQTIIDTDDVIQIGEIKHIDSN